MPYKIAIASGKGGTGKTTVSINLHHFIREKTADNIQLIDCDVEEPNDIIFFPELTKKEEEEIFQLIPEIDKEKCTYCGKCTEYCEFNAIVVIQQMKFSEVDPGLCHSCGACFVACKDNAINENHETIGKVTSYVLPGGNSIKEGRLKVGSAMQTMLIKELKKRVSDESNIIIYDAPPGTSCSVVETIADMDYVVLVSEPTPFGLHDLKLMVELLSQIQKPFGVIINKAGLGNTEIYQYLEKEGIELLGELPFIKKYASCYASGNLFEEIPDKIRDCYLKIMEKLGRRLMIHEGNNYFKW